MSFAIEPSGPFSLRAAAEFLAGFPPADRPDADAGEALELAFLLDSFDGAGAVMLRERDGVVHGEVREGPEDAVRAQAARMLSLDLDGSAYAAVGERDPVVGALPAGARGCRPVLYPSPTRPPRGRSSARASAGRRRSPCAAGSPRSTVSGPAAWPPSRRPNGCCALREVRGLTAEKVARLHAVAEAALAGARRGGAARAPARRGARAGARGARARPKFLAELVLSRRRVPDLMPVHAPRIRAAVTAAYGLDAPPDDDRLATISEAWRPYRGWVCLLLRASE